MSTHISKSKKTLIVFLLVAMSFTPLASFRFIPLTPQAQAFKINAEGDNTEWDCGLNGIGPGLFGSCVPIQVAADPNRGVRNVLKNIFTAVLYGAGVAFGQWLGSAINKKFQITDYFGYNMSVRDVAYRYRILFDKYLDPIDRKLVDIGYDVAFRGGPNFNVLYPNLQQLSQVVMQQGGLRLPSLNPGPLGATQNLAAFQDPSIYARLALLGAQETPESLYFNYLGASVATQAQAQHAADLETLVSDGYKSSRDRAELDTLAKYATNPNARSPDFYANRPGVGQILLTTGQIRSPGAYVAKVVQVAVQRSLNRNYLNTNVLYAAIAEGSAFAFFRLFSGGIFGHGTAALGQTRQSGSLGETTYVNPNAITNTGDEAGPSGGGGGGNAQCADGADNDGDGFIDSADPQCDSPLDNDESSAGGSPQCFDTIDNDGDGAIDFPDDPQCDSATDNDESGGSGNPQCSDTIDNDFDDLIDYPADPGCDSASDTSESGAGGGVTANLTANGSQGAVTVPSGSDVTLAWTCGGTAEGAFLSSIGEVGLTGSTSVTAAAGGTSYTLTCSNGPVTAFSIVTITVTVP